MWNFMIYTRYNLFGKIKKAEVGRACGTCLRYENEYRMWGEEVALDQV